MIDLNTLNQYRLYRTERGFYGVQGDGENGLFQVESPVDRKPLFIIASKGEGWEHVSISRKTRTPTWGEMEHVKRLFFKSDEAVMQIHPPLSDYVNRHPNCLHLWRPLDSIIPLPPSYMVG
jgi:hypothetical protein